MTPAAPRDLVMPKLGLTMKQGRISRWYVRPGEPFRRGQPLLQVTTEKVAVDVEAAYDGMLLEILVVEGATVPVGTPIARVETEEGSATAAAVPAVAPTPVAAAPAGAAPPSVAPSSAAPSSAAPSSAAPSSAAPPSVAPSSVIRATPAARRVARELGIDLSRVPGKGPESRLTEDDVRAYAAAVPTAGGEPRGAVAGPVAEVHPHSEWRRSVAEKMAASARSTAPVTLHREVDFSRGEVLLKAQLPPGAEGTAGSGVRVGPIDLVVKACAEALVLHPDLNASFTDQALLRHPDVNIGVALALPEGLIVPVLRGATGLPLGELARRRRELWVSARAGRLTPDDVTGGTFTVSNLGPFGVEGFTPIINPPEVAVMGVGRLAERPVVRGGRVVPRPVLTLSLTFDHRAVDGAPAAAFLDRVAALLADPPPEWSPRRPRISGEGAYDLAVVGSGPAGYAGATLGASLGARVALVESDLVGGVCLNRGCIPTKAALEHLLRGRPGDLHESVESAVGAIRAGAEEHLADLGVTVIQGSARLAPGPSGSAAPLMEIDGRPVRAAAVLLATGSEPVPFNLPRSLAMAGEKGKMGGGAEVITVEGLLSARRHPSRALVIGGGPGGVEAARILALGGASVTLVERLASLLPGEEEDVGELIRVGLEDLGVRVLTGTDAASLDAGAELIVLAVGRRARTADLGLTKAGSAWSGSLLDERGFVRVDSYLRTPVAGLFAAGDVTGPPFWAHRAMEQGRAAVVNALSGCEGFSRDLAPRLGPPDEHVPRVVFSDPEFGAVGLNRRAAEAAGHRVITGTAPMAASARARAAGKSAGFVRVAADRDTGRLLGAEAVSPAATELAAAGLLALRAGLTLEDLSASAFAHPTYAETLGEAARDAWVKRLSGAG